MQPMTTTRTLLLTAVMLAPLALVVAPTAQAGHLGSRSYRCTYIGQSATSTASPLPYPPPARSTFNGNPIGVGGCSFDVAGVHPAPDPDWSIIQAGEMQVGIVDDVFGRDIGGVVCADVDQDGICGDAGKGELFHAFCDSDNPTVRLLAAGDTNGDAHADFGAVVNVLVATSPYQVVVCGSTRNPVGGVSGGIFSPSGGISLNLN